MQALEKGREEQIVSWANYVLANKDWKKVHTEFINAQFMKQRGFFKRLLKTPGGRQKLRLLTGKSKAMSAQATCRT